jgi:hypothetical protein
VANRKAVAKKVEVEKIVEAVAAFIYEASIKSKSSSGPFLYIALAVLFICTYVCIFFVLV